MSVMSAAEARQEAGASTEIPPRRLQIAGSAPGQDDAVAAGSPLGAGDETQAEPGVTGHSASALRVTQVRVVREVRVRTLRADGVRRGTVPAPRAVVQSRPVTEPAAAPWAGAATEARVAARATAAARMTGQARGTARPGAVRLTRRGRRVVAALVIGVVIVAVTLLWMGLAGGVQASSHGSAPGSPYQGMTQVVVQPGQTLWSIAAAAEPSANAWAVVQQIINVNALSSANVQAGQLLWVPAH